MRSDTTVPKVRIALKSEPLAVRRALRGLFRDSFLLRLQEDQRGTAELLLAEVLNNVVEHAYANGTGDIHVSITLRDMSLMFRIVDHGSEMPGHALPAGVLADYARHSDLPEGGFGWHMIRALAKEVAYHRQDGHNELSFRLDLA